MPWVELEVGEALIATGVTVCEGVGGAVVALAELARGEGAGVVARLTGRPGVRLAVLVALVVVADAVRLAVLVEEVTDAAPVGRVVAVVFVAEVVVLAVVAVRVGAAVLVVGAATALGGGVQVGRTPLPKVQARTSPGLG